MALESSSVEYEGSEDGNDVNEREPEHLDLKSLDYISEIIVKLRRIETRGDYHPREDWLNPSGAFPPKPLRHSSILAKEDLRDANRVDETLTNLRLAADTLREISARVHDQIKLSESKARTLRLRAGISTLPDEVLGLILVHATYETHFLLRSEAELAAEAASDVISLTHVCRRFRALGLQIPSFWNRLSNAPLNLPMSLRCERAAKFDVEISMQSARQIGTGVAPFLQATKAFSEKWIRFTHGCERLHNRMVLYGSELKDLARETHELQAPNLSELAIHYSGSILYNNDARLQDPGEAFHYYSTWTVPKLKRFDIYHLVPVPFSGSPSLTTFRIQLDFRTKPPSSKLKSLVTFLSASPYLRTLDLSMNSLVALESFSIQNHQEFGSIEELALSLSDCEGASVDTFFDRISFPNVSFIKLKLEFPVGASYSDRIQDNFRDIFPNSARFPHLVSLHLKYEYTSIPLESKERKYGDVIIHLSALSSVQRLTLMLRNFGVDALATLPDGPCLPSLRSLTFESCSRPRRPFVAELLERLKSQGNLPRLTVEDCRWHTSPLEENAGRSDGRSETSDEGSESDSSSVSSSSGSRKGRHTEEKSSLVTVESMLELIE